MSDCPPEWNLLPIREIITESRINPEIDDPSKRVSVRLHCEGVEKRSERATDQAGATRYYKRLAGQFIYGKQNLHKGAVGIVPTELHGFCSSQDIPAFDITPSVDPNWFLYLFKQRNFYESLESIATGTGSKRIQPSELGEKEIAIPPLPEQKKIAEILSGIDIVIETTNNKIAKLRKSKVTLLHAFFQERSDGQAGIANLGGEVIRKRFGECLGIISGKGFEAKDYSASGTRLLRIENVSWETISWESVAYLPENIVKENQKLLLSEGDILLALNRPITQDKLKIARCSKGDLPAILYQRVGKIFTLDENTISNDFAYYLLQGLLPDFIASQSVGSDQPFINLTALRDLMLPLPQTDLQEKIVETLKSIDNSTAIHSKRVWKFLLLKKSLSSDLLSGRKRVSI